MLASPSPRPPPRRLPPPRRPPPSGSPRVKSTPGNRNISNGDNTVSKDTGISPQHKGDAPSTPLRHPHHDNSILSGSPMSSSSTTRIESSPLREAASLIQSLDIARTKMIGSAVDAATEAETARRNARTAQEIARRYQNRSYPMFKMDALESYASTAGSIATVTTTASSSFVITSRPKHPEITGFNNKHNGMNGGNDEEKYFENDKDGGDGHRVPHTPTPIYTSPTPKNSEQRNGSSNATVQNRGEFHSPTSFERIAQHHADDLLQLTMELERTKQDLKTEQRLRKQCQTSLSSLQSKTANLESINQKLREEVETERNESTTELSDLKKELRSSRMKLEAAEEDAQLALDLAKDSAEQRDEMEELLLKAQNEVDMLRQHGGSQQLTVVESPERHVHFADSDANTAFDSRVQNEEKALALFDAPREGGPSRAMIAAGRQLLLRRNMSPQDAVIRLELTPSKSAERRHKLSERLNKSLNESTNDDASIMLLSSSPSRTPFSPTPGSHTAITSGEHYTGSNSIANADMKNKLEEYHAATKTLETSGKRLDLDGYFWREHSKTNPPHTPIRIDQMARQYCQNVEFKIDRQQNNINQLESLLGCLENAMLLEK